MIKIETITPDLASTLCRKITADLPEYFGLPEGYEWNMVYMVKVLIDQ